MPSDAREFDSPAGPPEQQRAGEPLTQTQASTQAAELDWLISTLPVRLQASVAENGMEGLLEIVLDIGRVPTARYRDREIDLSDREVSEQEIDHVVSKISEFGEDNRAGIPRTLHRISAIRNRRGRIVGLTLRIGRSVAGSAGAIRDLIESGRSVLILGAPGVGKTTMLREAARLLADDLRKRVVIVDTSNEIGGDGDIPHPGIGRARRMQVARPELQHQVMIEAVENHMPEVIVIDEIGTALEASAARTIAERGVQLIGTAHGNTLANLMQNPTLSDLIGGIESVTLSDEEARRRGTQKTVLERRAPPTFDVLVEIQEFNRVAVHEDIARTVDALLRGFEPEAEVRVLGDDGEVAHVELVPVQGLQEERSERSDRGDRAGGAGQRSARSARPAPAPRGMSARGNEAEETLPIVREPYRGPVEVPAAPGGPQKRILPFGISRTRLEEAITDTRSAAVVVDSIKDADMVVTLRPYYRRRSGPLRDAEQRGVPVFVLRNNTSAQMEQALLRMRGNSGEIDPTTAALREAEEGIAAVQHEGQPSVELSPQNAYIRRLQHEIASRYGVRSTSRGREPYRRVTLIAEGAAARDLPWALDDERRA